MSTFPNNQAMSDVLPVIQENIDCPASSCCGLSSKWWVRGWVAVTVLLVLCVAYLAGRVSATREQAKVSGFPPIQASSSVTSEKYSMSTGPLSEDGEAVFVLDHNSGLLQCSIIYPRMRQMMGQYTVNISEALGAGGKGGSYIMTTGVVDFPRASNAQIGSSVVYVLDTATGNFACFGVPFNRQAVTTNQPQQGVMALIYTGTANPIINRDAQR
jgi:hypothetical protein